MSRFARIAVVLIAVAAVVLEVVVSWVYINDPGTIFANVAIVFYALIAVGAVGVVDRMVRVRRGQARPLLSRFAGRTIALVVGVAVVLEVVPGIHDGFAVVAYAGTIVWLVLTVDLFVGQARRLIGRRRPNRVTPA